MAIPSSKLSNLLGLCTTAEEMLSRLRGEGLLSGTASEDDVLLVIQEGLKETSDEIKELGFTWATAETRIASKLAHGGYLNEKGCNWVTLPGQSVLCRFLKRLSRKRTRNANNSWRR